MEHKLRYQKLQMREVYLPDLKCSSKELSAKYGNGRGIKWDELSPNVALYAARCPWVSKAEIEYQQARHEASEAHWKKFAEENGVTYPVSLDEMMRWRSDADYQLDIAYPDTTMHEWYIMMK